MLLLSTLLACATPALDGSPAGPSDGPVAEPPVREAEPRAPVAGSPASAEVCREGRSINTKVSVAAGAAVIDHFKGGERSERVTVAFADVQQVELEVVAEPACAAIWLVLRDGRRVLFDDDERADLAPRARRLAETMRVPFHDGTVAQNG